MSRTVDFYQQHLDFCGSRAKACPDAEIAALWLTIGDSYRFLIAREQRIATQERERSSMPAFEKSFSDKGLSAPADRLQKGLRVLYLEDDVFISMSTAETLESLECAVTACNTLSEAFAALNEQVVDVGLLDVNINGVPSYEVAEALERKGVPVGFLTGYQSPGLDSRWSNRPHCSKPCNRDELRALLARCLG